MKNKFQKTLLAFAFLLLANCLIAQTPQGIPYQAVARDNAGNLIKNQNIALQFKIHDGTATGPVVFTETHAVTTDALGLFSVNIGGGTSTSTLADVNWGSGAKFTQVELDVSGSSNYIDMGTTQMMSVPYALYAGSSGNSVSMMGAIGQSSSSNGATITSGVLSLTPADATNGGVVTTEAQTIAGSKTFSSAIKITAGTPGAGKVLTSDAAGLASWESASACGYAIGQNVTELGGIIFYLDASGCHGLVCAPTDQSTGIRWSNGSYPNTTAFADCVGGGAGNTSMIIYNQGGTNSGIAHSFAAGLARAYNGGGFSDWYLPCKYELNLMHNNIGQGNVLGLGNVGGFANYIYWSSNEYEYNYAWYQYFGYNGYVYYYKNFTFRVRAVRAF
jgi:hypothetical protein